MWGDQDILYTLVVEEEQLLSLVQLYSGITDTWVRCLNSWIFHQEVNLWSIMQPGVLIDYKAVRALDPAAARQMVLNYLSSGQTVAAAARAFGVTRPVVYAVRRKGRMGELKDTPRTPHHQPRKTPAALRY
jgi:hypothetical protein